MTTETDGNLVHVSGYGPGFVELRGLLSDERDILDAMVNGTAYVGMRNGRLIRFSAMKDLPAPDADPILTDHWPKAGPMQHTLFDAEPINWYMPAFIIHSLAAGGGTYEKEVKKAEVLGFDCLRSRRLPNGQFREHWYLSGLWAAKGGLKKAVDGIKEVHQQVDKAVGYLCENLKFGSLDVTRQRAALIYD